jgi:hypothetical protein
MSYHSETLLMCCYILHAHKNTYIENACHQDVMPCSLLVVHQYFRRTCSIYTKLHCVRSYTDVKMSAIKIVISSCRCFVLSSELVII